MESKKSCKNCRCGTNPCTCPEEMKMKQVINPKTNDADSCLPREIYVRFLESLYLIYSVMEDELEKNKRSLPLEAIDFADKLYRKKALAKDLKFFLGSKWRSEIRSTKATDAYVARIREVGESEPDLLLAHHYVRYMGDLSVCDVLREKTRACFKLSSSTNDGRRFYDFDNIENLDKFKDDFYSALELLEFDAQTHNKITKEAMRVYQLNLSVYWEIRSWMCGQLEAGDKDLNLTLDAKYGSIASKKEKNENRTDKQEKNENKAETEVEQSKSKPDNCCGLPLFVSTVISCLFLVMLLGLWLWYYKNRHSL